MKFFRKKSKETTLDPNEWPEFVVTLDDSTFSEFIEKYPLSLIDFWAPWCAPCKTLSPRIRRVSKLYEGKVAFGKLNVEKHKTIAKKYKIMSIPSVQYFHLGKKVAESTGVKSIGDLKQTIAHLLEKYCS
jgi:thioredoxin 1